MGRSFLQEAFGQYDLNDFLHCLLARPVALQLADDHQPATDAVSPMAGLVRPVDAASRRRQLHRADRSGGARVVPPLGDGRGRRLGRRRAHLPSDHLADDPAGRRRPGRPAGHPRDETRGSAAVPLVGASVASLLGVVFALDLAGRQSGPVRVLLIGVAVATVVLSWTVVNTVYTLRYADLHYRSREAGIVFGDPEGQEQPTYRDFAYVAFTIGMCYQVSDTTVRDRRIRGTVLSHAFLSYLFGVVIVAGSVNLIAGLLS
jgi:hypothetical protein